MVNITLSNQNPHSQHQKVSININTGLCYFNDNQEIPLKHLINTLDFTHPLLTEKFTQTSDHVFHYEYDNIDELRYSGIYVYSRLIRADKPLACTFKINPSPLFQHSKFAQDIYFSINRHQLAKESIHIKQLEDLTHHLLGTKFVFSEDLIIDDQFTIADLPPFVDGDSLYITNDKLVTLLKTPSTFSRYELRYISPEIGFGVFSKKTIKKEDIISIYSGVKTIRKPDSLSFSFIAKQDCFMMYLDASQYGNITRFINHAPTHNSEHSLSLIEANVKANTYSLNGIEVIVYSACKEILPGEQLLVDYGQAFFEGMDLFRFKTNGRPINTNKKFIWSNIQEKINHMKIMARHGVKKAQIYLLARVFIIITLLWGVLQASLILAKEL